MKKFQLFCFVFWMLTIPLRAPEAIGATLTPIRVGYPSPSASFFPLFATREAGLFQKYGFEPEMIYVQGVQMIQVHVAGQLDFSSISSVVYLQAAVEGADLIQIASSIDNQLMKIMVDPSISKPADLKGKTIGVTRLGSLTDLLLRPALKDWGLDPQKDVKIVQIGRMPDIATAISQKRVAAGVISFPTSVHAEKLGLKTLLDFVDSEAKIPATTVVVSRRYSQANRNRVMNFLKAYIEGTTRLFADRELGIRALRKYGGISDRELLAYTYDLFTSRYIKKMPKVNPKGIVNSLELIAESNPKAKNRKPEEFMDTSFMDELEKTGFLK